MQIAFIGDFLRQHRITKINHKSIFEKNMLWLYELLKQPISIATGYSTDTFNFDDLEDKYNFNIQEFLSFSEHDHNTDGWICNYNRTEILPAEIEYFQSRLPKDSFFIGYELSPFVLALLEQAGYRYINVLIHPARFAGDYFFFMDSNDPNIHQALSNNAISNEELKLLANYKKSSHIMFPNKAPLEQDALLFCGQSLEDSALISEKRMVLQSDYFDDIRTLIHNHPYVYFKPHPHTSKAERILQLFQDSDNTEIIYGDFYELLARDEITTVAAISSGCLYEAALFGKKTIRLLDNFYNYDKYDRYTINNICLLPNFWEEVFNTNNDDKKPSYINPSDLSIKESLKVFWKPSPALQLFELNHTYLVSNTLITPSANLYGLEPDLQWFKPINETKTWLNMRLLHQLYTDVAVILNTVIIQHKTQSNTVRFYLDNEDVCLYELYVPSIEEEQNKNVVSAKIRSIRKKQHTNNYNLIYKSITLNIPKERRNSNTFFKIGMEVDHSFTILDENNNIADTRALSFGLQSFRVEPAIPALQMQARPIMIDFSDPNLDQESIKAWQVEDEETILHNNDIITQRFIFHKAMHSDLCLQLNHIRFHNIPEDQAIKITLSAQDKDIDQAIIHQNQQGEAVLFNVPNAYLEDERKEVTLNLAIEQISLLSEEKIVDAKGYISFSSFYFGAQFDIHRINLHSPKLFFAYKQKDQDTENPDELFDFEKREGVTIIGQNRISTGMGHQARNTAQAIALKKGADHVSLYNYDPSKHQAMDFEFEKNFTFHINNDINIFLISPKMLEMYAEEYEMFHKKHAYSILYAAWELEALPSHLSNDSLFDEYWGVSNFVAQAMEKKTHKPVYPILEPVNIELPKITKGRDHFNLDNNRFLFLFTYCSDSTLVRKNPMAVIHAFQKAFPDKNASDVGLILKTKINQADDENYAKHQDLVEYINDDPRITIITDNLPYDDVKSLYLCVDAYISLHRSEGFGLTMAEAMGYGKPTIATAYSGNLDFMNEHNSCLVNYDKIQLEEGDYHNQNHQFWADPDIDHAAYFMKKLFNDKIFYRKLTRQGQYDIHQNLSMSAIGQKITQRLEEIRNLKKG